ncbi:MAG TPA: iron-sulfur cluster repair di-iron protein [bacterium]
METQTKKFEINKTIGEIASEFQAAIPLFEDMKIDYCCGGNRTLRDACSLAGVPVEKVVSALEKLDAESAARQDALPDWKNKTMAELIDHILAKHHVYTRSQLSRLKVLSAKVKGVHGAHHSELSRLDEIIKEMAGEMEGHMAKEEEQVFPYLRALEAAGGKKDGIHDPFQGGPTENHPLKVLMWEHGMTGEEFLEIHKLTNDFTLPKDACQSYKALYRGLKEMEEDLHQHVHMENNILFERVLKSGWMD